MSKSQPNLLDNGALNNGMTIKNNLSHKDAKNRHWEKLGFSFDDDGTSSLGNIKSLGGECNTIKYSFMLHCTVIVLAHLMYCATTCFII